MNILLILGFTFVSLPGHGKVLTNGSAFSAWNRTVENLFWNPAGIGGKGYTSSIQNYSGISIGVIGYTGKFKKIDFGIGVKYLNSGSMLKTNSSGDSTGTFSSNSILPALAFRYQMEDLSMGLKIYTPYVKIDEYSSAGAGLDAGIIYEHDRNLNLTLFLRNAGYQFSPFLNEKEKFPLEIRLGGLYRWRDFTISLEGSMQEGLYTGLNWNISEKVTLTAGYNGSLSELSRTGWKTITGVSLGIDLKIKKFKVNTGFVNYGTLGLNKMISIGYGG